MTYHLLNSKRDRNRKLILFFFLVCLFVFSYTAFGFFKFSLDFLYFGVTPVLNQGLKVGENMEGSSLFLKSKKTLMEENALLREELAQARLKVANADLLWSENIEFKSILEKKSDEKMVLASVLSKPNRSPYDSLVIDIGSSLDIKVGDKVLVGGNVLIGEIVDVGETFSKVKLYSSYGEEFEAFITSNNIMALAHGRGGGNFDVELPRDVDVKIGDTVILPAIDDAVLGLVEEVFIDPVDSSQKILFRTPVNIFELRSVQVLLGK